MLEKLPESVGEALHNRRAGLENTVYHRLANLMYKTRVQVRSAAFTAGQPIPTAYTADGDGISPPLQWTGIPNAAASLVVIVEDADSPTSRPLVHAIIVNLDKSKSSLVEGALSSPDHRGTGLQAGRNSYLSHAWLPPDPPPAHGIHRYVFQVFALRSGAAFSNAPGRQEVFSAIAERAVGAGFLIGTYERVARVRLEEPKPVRAGNPSAIAVSA
jgi:Raf kinase inhibitor-like YbhB/YbcL family protein